MAVPGRKRNKATLNSSFLGLIWLSCKFAFIKFLFGSKINNSTEVPNFLIWQLQGRKRIFLSLIIKIGNNIEKFQLLSFNNIKFIGSSLIQKKKRSEEIAQIF